MTSTTTLSPSMTRSPARRVILSIKRSCSAARRCGRLRRKQGSPERAVARLVDHLVALAVPHEDRRLEIGAEVLERLSRPYRDVDRDRRDVVEPEPLGVLVGQLNLTRGEEARRVGDWQRQFRILKGVQPEKRALLVGGEQRVTRPAEPDQPVGK